MPATTSPFLAADPPRIHGRTLLVFFGDGLSRPRTGLSLRGPARWWNSIFSLSVRYRDFYRNPRDPERMLAYLDRVLTAGERRETDLVALEGVSVDTLPRGLNFLGCVGADWPPRAPSPAAYDTMVLVYPDPLGLGWGKLESRLSSGGCANVLVLNGRGRLFALNPGVTRVLRRRRLLARWRWPDLCAGLLVPGVACVLAGVDAIRGIRKKGSV